MKLLWKVSHMPSNHKVKMLSIAKRMDKLKKELTELSTIIVKVKYSCMADEIDKFVCEESAEMLNKAVEHLMANCKIKKRR